MASRSFNVHEAKTHLSRLIKRVEGGEEIVLARAGRPVARLVPFRLRTQPRVPGAWRAQVQLAPDFDALDEKLLSSFEE